MPNLRQTFLKILSVPIISKQFSYFIKNKAVVFMLHRFTKSDLGIKGHDPEFLKSVLCYLKREKYEIISLGELFKRLESNEKNLSKTIVFTIDDGYQEQAEFAESIFHEFNCPVTIFVVSNFLDGKIWLWWDKIEYIFNNTTHEYIQIKFNGEKNSYNWKDENEKDICKHEIIEHFKILPDKDKLLMVAKIASMLNVKLPVIPPTKYAPMSWGTLRNCENKDISFGPHTMNHPILSNVSNDDFKEEILGSWNRLKKNSMQPLKIFCYPNGKENDFGKREILFLSDNDFIGALSTVRDYAHKFENDNFDTYNVPRYEFPDNMQDVIQIISGFDRFKRIIRNFLTSNS